MDDAELLRELRENCQCFQRPTFADPPCAICRAIDLIERQGKALRAVAELAQRWRRDIDPANQVDKNDPFYDEGIEDSADELEKTLKAALAQTEPQI